MFLTFQRHQIISSETAPFVARGLYDLSAWRDRNSALSGRIRTQIALSGLCLIALIEAAIRLPLALLGALFLNTHEYKKFQNSILILGYSGYGLCVNLFTQTLSTFLIDFDIKLRSSYPDCLLFEACETGREDLIRDLLKKGADPHRYRELDVSSALLPTLLGYPQLNALFQLNSYETLFLKLKSLSHWLSLKGTYKMEKGSLMLEGCLERWMFDVISKRLSQFFKDKKEVVSLNENQSQTLIDTLDAAYTTQSPAGIAERIQSTAPTFVSVGWRGHIACMCFFAGYLAIGNRGQRPLNASTLEVYRIDSSRITPELIEELLSYQLTSPSVGKEYIYTTFIKKLQGRKNALCHAFSEIAPKEQKNGVCALSSKKSALRFIWAMLLNKRPSKEILMRAKNESKLFTDWSGSQEFDSFPSDKPLPECASQKAQSKKSRFLANLPLVY